MRIDGQNGAVATGVATLSGGLDPNGIPAGVPVPKEWGAYKFVANAMTAAMTAAIARGTLDDLGTELPGHFKSSGFFRLDLGTIKGAQHYGYFNTEEHSPLLIARLDPSGPHWFQAR